MAENNNDVSTNTIFDNHTVVPKFCSNINITINNHKTVVITFGFERSPGQVVALGSFAMDKDLSSKLETFLHDINTNHIK